VIGSVHYNYNKRTSSANKIPLEAGSVQLITASSAAHWFNLPQVYEEGRRVLCPGGVMAFLVQDCNVTELLLPQDPSQNGALKDLLRWVSNLQGQKLRLQPSGYKNMK
jgi:ubiquinone/menaquinone biosynthesis C-methylase UbiE